MKDLVASEVVTEEINQAKEEKKKKKRWWLLILLLLLLLFGWRACQKQEDVLLFGDTLPSVLGAEEGDLPTLSDEEILERMQLYADASKFSIDIEMRPVFENGKSEGTIQIANPSYNVYPFAVEIYLDETNELLYQSGGVLPGHYIASGKLLVNLSSGTYAATAKVKIYDPETEEYLSTQEFALEIMVNN